MTTATGTSVTTKAPAKPVSVKSIKSQLMKAEHLRRDVTISALFHALCKANIAWAEGWTRLDSALLDGTLRGLCPTRYVESNEAKGIRASYQYNKDKAIKVLAELGVERDVEFSVFYSVLLAYWEKNNGKRKEQELSLDDQQEQMRNQMARLLKKWLDSGISLGEVEVMLKRARAGQEILPKAVKGAK